MPVGSNTWQVALNQQWVDENISLSLLFDDIDVAEHQALFDAARGGPAMVEPVVLAAGQLGDVAGVSIEGMTGGTSLIGVYLPEGEHKGWPHFATSSGDRHLYRQIDRENWFL